MALGCWDCDNSAVVFPPGGHSRQFTEPKQTARFQIVLTKYTLKKFFTKPIRKDSYDAGAAVSPSTFHLRTFTNISVN